jgi:chromate transporter
MGAGRNRRDPQLADQQAEDRLMQDRAYPTIAEATRIWARIGLLSFGGPAGQIALMHRILVEEQRWLGEKRFLHALNYCMLLPGPEAMQLAVYIGWLMHRTLGGIIAGVLFVLPGVVSIMALSWIYALYGNVGAVEALFFGLKAAVLAIVVQAVIRIGSRALANGAMIAIAAAAFVAIFAFGVPFPLIILAAGLIGFFGARAGLPAFQGGGGHGAVGKVQVADAYTLLGEETPAHTAVNRGHALRISAVFLVLGWRPWRCCSRSWVRPMSLPRSRASSASWPLSPSAAPMRFWPMSRRRRCRTTAGWRRARCWTGWAWPRRRRVR